MINVYPEVIKETLDYLEIAAGGDWLKYWMKHKWQFAVAFQSQTSHS